MNRINSSSSQNPKFPFIESTEKGLFIRVRLQPRSSKNAIDGVQNGALKIKLTAPPVEGEANRALIEFLSDALDVKKSALSIDSGLKSRDKRVRVADLSQDGLEKIFSRLLLNFKKLF